MLALQYPQVRNASESFDAKFSLWVATILSLTSSLTGKWKHLRNLLYLLVSGHNSVILLAHKCFHICVFFYGAARRATTENNIENWATGSDRRGLNLNGRASPLLMAYRLFNPSFNCKTNFLTCGSQQHIKTLFFSLYWFCCK